MADAMEENAHSSVVIVQSSFHAMSHQIEGIVVGSLYYDFKRPSQYWLLHSQPFCSGFVTESIQPKSCSWVSSNSSLLLSPCLVTVICDILLLEVRDEQRLTQEILSIIPAVKSPT